MVRIGANAFREIELNPGPTVEEMLETILKTQTQIQARLTQIEEKLEPLSEYATKINNLDIAVESLQRTIEQQQERLIELEDRARRNNLLVFGVTETDKETRQDIEEKVLKNIFSTRLGVTVSSVERIHRIGQKKSKQDRPVIVRFYDYNEKMAIFRSCKKLRGTNIAVSDDYSKETLEKRKSLWRSALDDRRNGAKVKLVRDKLYIDDAAYTWDSRSHTRVKVKNAQSEARSPV